MELNTNNLWKMAYDGLSKELAAKQEELKKVQMLMNDLLVYCPHLEVVPKSYYFPGSYNDKAYTERWNQCVCCRKQFDITHTDHSYYG